MAEAPTAEAAIPHPPAAVAQAGGGRGSSSSSLAARQGVQEQDYDVFGRDELVMVLSHYDLGVVTQIEEFRRGSRRAPKLVIRTDRGQFLLKRRAPGR